MVSSEITMLSLSVCYFLFFGVYTMQVAFIPMPRTSLAGSLFHNSRFKLNSVRSRVITKLFHFWEAFRLLAVGTASLPLLM
jgi:hypothetical protein